MQQCWYVYLIHASSTVYILIIYNNYVCSSHGNHVGMYYVCGSHGNCAGMYYIII